MKKSVKYALFAVLAVCLIGLVIYHLPIRVEKTVNMTNSDGQTVELKADVTFHRSLIRPTVLKGTILFDGERYIDREAWEESYYKRTFQQDGWQAFLDKWSGRIIAEFSYGDAKEPDEAVVHSIHLSNIGFWCSLDDIVVCYFDGIADEIGHTGVYYNVVEE